MMSWFPFRRKLNTAEQTLLLAVADGAVLKSHRYLDGRKQYQLHPLEGEAQDIPYAIVQHLLRHKYLTTNQKFPAATFLLTNKGKAFAADHGRSSRGLGSIVEFEG